jgi:hypothetical protein
MEPTGSLQCSQELSTFPYPDQTNLVQTTSFYLHKIHLNIIHQPTSLFS